MPMQMDVQTNPAVGFRVNPGELELGIRMMRAGIPSTLPQEHEHNCCCNVLASSLGVSGFRVFREF